MGGRQRQRAAAGTGSSWSFCLAGTFWTFVEWPEQQLERLARAALCRTWASGMRRLGSGRHTGISHAVFLRTPLPLVFRTERLHDRVRSGNAARCATSLRLTTPESTLKALKIPAEENLFDCIYPSNPRSLTKGPFFTEPCTMHFERCQRRKAGTVLSRVRVASSDLSSQRI